MEIGRKLGRGLCPFFGEGTPGSPSNIVAWTEAYGGILIHAAIWPQQLWTENWMGLCPFGRGGARSPFSTMWPGPRPTCTPSFILIRPTIWPQCTNVTDRQTGQDRQRSDSIGRTVLQTVAQKSYQWLFCNVYKLWCNVLHNPQHVLHELLPPVSASCHSYSIRPRAHNRQLPDRLSHLVDYNFIIRMLFYQSYWHLSGFIISF